LSVWLVVAAAAAAVLLVPRVSDGVLRRLGVVEPSFVDRVALAMTCHLTCLGFLPLMVYGEPPTTELVTRVLRGDLGEVPPDLEAGTVDNLLQLLSLVLGALMCVGIGVRRGFRDALVRLGFTRMTAAYALLAVGVAALANVCIDAAMIGVDHVWTFFGWRVTDWTVLEKLFPAEPGAAMVSMALMAGVGEEALVRGALQPRLGIVLSNAFFVSVHAINYNWDALLITFLMGLVFGLVRARTNTTSAAIAHGLYDLARLALVSLAA
jgi:membrane protease YdiL (CAAX protease family)